MSLSETEGGDGPAIHVNSDVSTINPHAHKIFYEFAYVHPQDSSLHVYLSPRNARMALMNCRGQRFPISWIAPASYIMVYAPKHEDEVDVECEIVRAAICFAVRKELHVNM